MAFRSRQTLPDGGRKRLSARILPGIERWLEAERTQLPLWSPVMFGIGILVWFALPTRAEWMAFLCLALAGSIALLFLAKGSGRLARNGGIAFLLIALGCMIAWAKAERAGAPVLARAATVRIVAVIDRVEPLPARDVMRLVVRPQDRIDLPPRLRVNIAWDDLPAGGPLRPSDRLTFRARLMPPAPPTLPGGYDYARRAWFDGVGATGRVLPPLKVVERAPGGGPALRERLSSHVASRIDGAPGAIAVALATGDRGRIAPEDEEAMQRAGLSHLLSISGVHVTALIGAVVFLVYRVLGLSMRLALRWPLLLIAAGAGAGAGLGYTLLTGAEVPTIRSCVTALLVMAGLALGREAISLRLLACGALFVMLFWPESVIGPSFQLSFAAVAAIVCLYEHPRIRAAFQARSEAVAAKGLRLLAGLFVTGLAVELVLTPIALFHFHRAGLYGSLANMVAIPLTEFVIMPAEALALLLDLAGAGAPAWWVVERSLALLLAMAHAIGGRGSAVALSPAIPSAALATVMAGIFWCMLWRTNWRWAGLPVVAIGLAGYIVAPVPDILVSADGRHVALRLPDGAIALLRDRAGDYIRDQFAEQAAFDGELKALADLPTSRCSPDFCMAEMEADGRRHRILMTRSRVTTPWRDLVAACAAADIVIADRRLPDACRPRWLKLDRADLARAGGAAVMLASGTIRRGRDPGDEHPWMQRTPPPRPNMSLP